MSGEKTPILSGAIPAFELFITDWEKLASNHPCLEVFIAVGLDWAYQYYGKMDCTWAGIYHFNV
jgi:hypothetical protein